MADELQMRFEANTIEHLGVKMYSHIPNAIAELIANAYDADATEVQVKLYDTDDKKIEIRDDGHGMDFDEVNDKFLRIGRNRRKDKNNATISPNGRKTTGKKGLGKLALFGIGNLIEITTVKKNSKKKLEFILSWIVLKETKEGENYKPEFFPEACGPEEHGTSIILTDLRDEEKFDAKDLAVNLSRLFNCFDKNFKCFVSLNDDEVIEVNNELKFDNIDEEFRWEFPEFSKNIDIDYENKGKIYGKIISTEKPLKDISKGIALFANGRLVNAPAFFRSSESSHVFSYLTGWLNVDFIDNIDEDIIATNRQSLTWDVPATKTLRLFLAAIISKVAADWRIKRKEKKDDDVKDQTGIDIDEWLTKQPKKIRELVKAILGVSATNSAMPTKKYLNLVKDLYELAPPYFYYHWRNLHDEIKNASEDDYMKLEPDYYRAFSEAVKRYAKSVKTSSGYKEKKLNEQTMMSTVFGVDNKRLLSVTEKYKKLDEISFNEQTLSSIEDGQKFLSMGIVAGARNPISHEEIVHLKDSDLFNEQDCLDALSLLSHLFRRLDDAEKINKQPPPE